MVVYRTVAGNHARDHVNRRQIDVIRNEVIPAIHLKKGELIGIVTPYRNQADELQREFSGTDIKADTVDKFQGMERNIIIVSTVRSNKNRKLNGFVSSNSDAGFAKSPERLNVALSRARRLLIVVGNKSFFSGIKDCEGKYLYRNAINEIEKNGLVIEYNDLKRL
jgi:superfamily I DNA and/or RNA helicase